MDPLRLRLEQTGKPIKWKPLKTCKEGTKGSNQISEKGASCEICGLGTQKFLHSRYLLMKQKSGYISIFFGTSCFAVGDVSFKNNRARWSLRRPHISDTSSGQKGHCNGKVVFQPLFFRVSFRGNTFIHYYQLSPLDSSDICFEKFDSQKHILIWMGLNVGTFFSQSTVPSFFSPCFMNYPTFHAPSTAPFAAKLQHAPQRACCCTWVERVFEFNQHTSQVQNMKMKPSLI